MSRLKNLYRDLVDNRKHVVQGWHDSYKRFCNEVEVMQQRIENGQRLNKNDETLRKCLETRLGGNAITTRFSG